MRSLRKLPSILLAVGALCLTACGGGPDNSSPAGAINASVSALKSNDLTALVNNVVPADKLAEARAEWTKKSMSDEEKAEFNMKLGMLTAAGAEDNIFMMLKPNLAEAQMGLQQGIGMLGMVAAMSVNSPDMSPEEQANFQKLMQGMQAWGQGIDLNDEAKLKQALGIACNAVRATGIKNADDLMALSFDQAMVKGGGILAGAKQILSLYKLDLDGVLNSISVGSPTINGDLATLPVTVTVFGQTFTGPATYKQVAGKWFAENSLD
jgi:hypothetical protein